MARRVFFSFHYDRDVHRAHVVRNSWLTKADREQAGFFDSSVFESKQRTSDDALKRFLNDGLVGSSVTCVLAGNQTAWRRWVRYELLRSFVEGKGIFGVKIHSISRFNEGPDLPGPDPLSLLSFLVEGNSLRFREWDGIAQQWIPSRDVSSMPLASVRYDLNGMANHTFNCLFPTYDWSSGNGYASLGSWVERAAVDAGR